MFLHMPDVWCVRLIYEHNAVQFMQLIAKPSLHQGRKTNTELGQTHYE